MFSNDLTSLPLRAMIVALAFAGASLDRLQAAERPRVLVLSIDGMGPDYVLRADELKLKIPTLRRFLKDGSYASGVIGVVPTFTYPSHTTLMTGVSPAEHGIHNNTMFDPLGTLRGKVNTDAAAIKVDTLWRAARAAGYVTASVGWPITTGSTDIDYLMPANAAFEGKATDGEPVEQLAPDLHYDHPAGLRELLAPDIQDRPDLSIVERRFAWSMAILRRYQPTFMTVHLGELDHAEHVSGPFSEMSNRAIESVDARVAQLIELERSIDPDAYIVIVSDHGQAPIEKAVHLGVLFIQQGLVRPETADRPGSWDAALWPSGGTAAVMLRDPSDQAVQAKVEAVLQETARNPAYGIARILGRDEVVKCGGYPDASYIIEMQIGFRCGNGRKGEIIRKAPHTGNHGFLPERPEMHASFLVMGPGVAAGRDLGIIDMRQVAPTLAGIMGVRLPAAKEAPLDIRR